MDSFEVTGIWGLQPNFTKASVVPGTLYFKKNGGLQLKLSGSFVNSGSLMDSSQYESIYGLVNARSGETHFTLLDSFQTRLSMSMPGLAQEEIKVNISLAGRQHLKPEERTFRAARVTPPGLLQWLDLDFLKLTKEHGDGGAYRIAFEPYHELEIKLRQYSVHLVVGYASEQSRFSGIKIKPEAWFEGRKIPNLELVQIFTDFVRPLQNLFSFVMDQPGQVAEVQVGSSEQEVPANEVFWFTVNYEAASSSTDDRGINGKEPIFYYAHIKDRLSQVFQSWLDFSLAERDFCDIYFAAKEAPDAYVESRFHSIMQSLSLLIAPQPHIDHDEPRTRDRVLAALAIEGYDSTEVDLLLPEAAELEFPAKLREKILHFQDLIFPLTGLSPDDLTLTLLRIRAFTTYRRSSHRFTGTEVFDAIEMLGILIRAIVLGKLGFSDEEARKLVARTRAYRYLSQRNPQRIRPPEPQQLDQG